MNNGGRSLCHDRIFANSSNWPVRDCISLIACPPRWCSSAMAGRRSAPPLSAPVTSPDCPTSNRLAGPGLIAPL